MSALASNVLYEKVFAAIMFCGRRHLSSAKSNSACHAPTHPSHRVLLDTRINKKYWCACPPAKCVCDLQKDELWEQKGLATDFRTCVKNVSFCPRDFLRDARTHKGVCVLCCLMCYLFEHQVHLDAIERVQSELQQFASNLCTAVDLMQVALASQMNFKSSYCKSK